MVTQPHNGAPIGAGRKILVADDEQRVIRFIASCLEEARYAVVATPDWREVVELARAEGPNLIVLDLWMPRLGESLDGAASREPTGCEIIRALRADPAFTETPIVLLASWSARKDPPPPPCVDLPGSALSYLYKPFSCQQLLERVGDPRPGDPAQHDRSRHLAQFQGDIGWQPPKQAARGPWWRRWSR